MFDGRSFSSTSFEERSWLGVLVDRLTDYTEQIVVRVVESVRHIVTKVKATSIFTR